MVPKGRRVAAVLGAGAIVLAVSLGLILKDRIAERYWLRLLATGSESEKLVAIGKLGEIGGPESRLRLHEDRLRRLGPEAPDYLLPGLPGFARPRDATDFKRQQLPGTSEAIRKIAERFGWRRHFARAVAILDDGTFDLASRLVVAQTVVMVATDPVDRPEAFDRTWPGGAEGPPDGQERIARARQAKERAIPVLVEAIRSDDPIYRKAAAYSLSFCGPEATMARPALEEAIAADEDEETRRYARLALQSISPAGGAAGGRAIR